MKFMTERKSKWTILQRRKILVFLALFSTRGCQCLRPRNFADVTEVKRVARPKIGILMKNSSCLYEFDQKLI